MILDCFTFFNELDILELRLTLFDRVVDRFVVCEAPYTFRGDRKPLVFAEHRERFARWNDRIVHLVYDATPAANPWHNEWGQRAHLTTALIGLAPDDLVLIGDVDELPAPEHAASRPLPGRILAHRHVLAVGYVNRFTPVPWLGTKAVAYGDLGTRTLNDVRSLPAGESVDVIESGWHFSALGGAAVMSAKIRAYSHTETDIPYLNDAQRLAVHFESEIDARWVPLDDRFPAALHEPRWAPYVWAQPPPVADAAALMHAHGCYATVPADSAAVAALATEATASAWRQAGTARFGDAFAGVHASVAALAALPAGSWVVIDGLTGWPAAELGVLAERGIAAVAYARNARSFATVRAVMDGEAFPAGPAAGLPELEAHITGAAYRIVHRDDVMSSIFAPAVWEQSDPFDAVAGPFRFTNTTRRAMHHFSTYAYVFTLRPDGARAGGSPP